jgi:RNA polymerase-binding transcription factor DksA
VAYDLCDEEGEPTISLARRLAPGDARLVAKAPELLAWALEANAELKVGVAKLEARAHLPMCAECGPHQTVAYVGNAVVTGHHDCPPLPVS